MPFLQSSITNIGTKDRANGMKRKVADGRGVQRSVRLRIGVK